MAMVVNANKISTEYGGHISSYASSATLYEVGFNHFWRGATDKHEGDMVFIQGHSSPGIYSRAFLEGRLNENDLNRFRQEVGGGGLSSYPHPWLMPDFWQFPTVSMGLGPMMAIYQARFMRYMEHRGMIEPTDRKVWAFLGDGEMDEPESMGAITMPVREGLDNLVFVVNCNLQRLDGPVRGNGKIIQELEAAFGGAGWNVVKVVWGSKWDPLLAKDQSGHLRQVMEETVDGEYQKIKSMDGKYVRDTFLRSTRKPPRWWPTCRMTKSGTSIAAVTTRSRFMRPTTRRQSTRMVRRLFSPRRSRVLAWVRPARVRTPLISRRRWTSKRSRPSGTASIFL